ncbi:MAG: hypothetical protein WBZ16_12310, partial [Pseudolabrys sp.]
ALQEAEIAIAYRKRETAPVVKSFVQQLRTRARMRNPGFGRRPAISPPAPFIRAETKNWGKIVRDANIKPIK